MKKIAPGLTSTSLCHTLIYIFIYHACMIYKTFKERNNGLETSMTETPQSTAVKCKQKDYNSLYEDESAEN